MSAAVYFDRLAPRYDELWSGSLVGMAQRAAVWREIDGLFRRGSRVLDLGCGTGDDALRLARAGVFVTGVDVSERMLQIARQRAFAEGVPVECRRADLESFRLPPAYDGALSNFGALNCLVDLDGFAARLAGMLRRGAPLALCWMGNCCAWEIAWYLAVGRPAKAFRRLRAGGSRAAGLRVRYPSAAEIAAAFVPYFRFVRQRGIGLTVPPSYLECLAARHSLAFRAARRIDRAIAGGPVLRALADHRLFLFERR